VRQHPKQAIDKDDIAGENDLLFGQQTKLSPGVCAGPTCSISKVMAPRVKRLVLSKTSSAISPEARGTTAWTQEVEQRREQLPRGSLGLPAGMGRKIVLASENTLMAGMEWSRVSG